MPPIRKTFPVGHARWSVQITDDESRTLVDPAGNVAYHSGSGALTETQSVYLTNSGVTDRLESSLPTRVLEIGLGTGLGMILTLDAALATETPLQFTAIEKDWLPADVLSRLNLEDHVRDSSIVARFLIWRRSLGHPVPEGVFQWKGGPRQMIRIHHSDAGRWQADAADAFDAIYFDPFAPAENPELWSPGFLSKMHQSLHPDGRLVTYCVSRAVRDAFASVGFHVRRVRGPQGGKREVLIATKRADG